MDIKGNISCSSEDKYVCLFNLLEEKHMENCLGSKLVFQPLFNLAECDTGRYQPIVFTTHGNSECIYSKSKCADEGQLVFSNDSSSADTACRCDYTKGYAFVTRPKNRCFCNPSDEDCSCFRSTCTTLSAGYSSAHHVAYFIIASIVARVTTDSIVKTQNEHNHVVDVRKTAGTVNVKSGDVSCRTSSTTRDEVVIQPNETTVADDISTQLNGNENTDECGKLHFARLVFIGKHGVGKTSLMKRLLWHNKEDVTSTESTDGIEVEKCNINIADGKWSPCNETDDDVRRLIRQVFKGKMLNEERKATETVADHEPLSSNKDESRGESDIELSSSSDESDDIDSFIDDFQSESDESVDALNMQTLILADKKDDHAAVETGLNEMQQDNFKLEKTFDSKINNYSKENESDLVNDGSINEMTSTIMKSYLQFKEKEQDDMLAFLLLVYGSQHQNGTVERSHRHTHSLSESLESPYNLNGSSTPIESSCNHGSEEVFHNGPSQLDTTYSILMQIQKNQKNCQHYMHSTSLEEVEKLLKNRKHMESLFAKENLPVDICCFCHVKGISSAFVKLLPLLQKPPNAWQDHDMCKRVISKIVSSVTVNIQSYLPYIDILLQRPVFDRLSVVSASTIIAAHSYFNIPNDQRFSQIATLLSFWKLLFCFSHPNTRISKELLQEQIYDSSPHLFEGYLSCCLVKPETKLQCAKQVEKFFVTEVHHGIKPFLLSLPVESSSLMLPVIAHYTGLFIDNNHVCKTMCDCLNTLGSKITDFVSGLTDQQQMQGCLKCIHLTLKELAAIITMKTADLHMVQKILSAYLVLCKVINPTRHLRIILVAICSRVSDVSIQLSSLYEYKDDDFNLLSNDIPMSGSPDCIDEWDGEDTAIMANSPGTFPECLTLNLSNNSGSLPSGRLSALSQHSDRGGNKSPADSDSENESSDWDSWDEEPEGHSALNETFFDFLQKLKKICSSGSNDSFTLEVKKLESREKSLIKGLLDW
ncbi:unnamed protein product [Mytilus edulis]|uniref:Uncharacterized protein n=1 Tax=Mytilus edulis TaxID=6550 RepID=A0A8S3S0A0_MYTED|nr:unnamed protein product [Mytilus edulis]